MQPYAVFIEVLWVEVTETILKICEFCISEELAYFWLDRDVGEGDTGYFHKLDQFEIQRSIQTHKLISNQRWALRTFIDGIDHLHHVFQMSLPSILLLSVKHTGLT